MRIQLQKDLGPWQPVNTPRINLRFPNGNILAQYQSLANGIFSKYNFHPKIEIGQFPKTGKWFYTVGMLQQDMPKTKDEIDLLNKACKEFSDKVGAQPLTLYIIPDVPAAPISINFNEYPDGDNYLCCLIIPIEK